jgi:undecaprenyl phosphate N,N'-diacetylbacillosamine 1-phosphate transferase
MYKFIKRFFDIVVSFIAMPFLLLLIIVFGFLIYIEDKGPIFYYSPRIGKQSKKFYMIKFRSMKVNAPDIRNSDGSTFNSKNDPRVTKIGRFLRETSLDETAQFINILKGDMRGGDWEEINLSSLVI